LVEEKDHLLTQDDCSGAYVSFCRKIGWLPLASTKACPIIEDEIMREFGLSRRNDIKGSNGKDQRGWKGIKVK
jgi:hypothetical protein